MTRLDRHRARNESIPTARLRLYVRNAAGDVLTMRAGGSDWNATPCRDRGHSLAAIRELAASLGHDLVWVRYTPGHGGWSYPAAVSL